MDISLRNKIKEDIESTGFYIVATSRAADCECCKEDAKKTGKELPHVFTKHDDGMVFTIGQSLKGRPELLAFVGPTASEGMLTKAQLNDRIQDAASFLSVVATKWDTFSLRANCVYSQNEDFGWVMPEEEQDPEIQEAVKMRYLSGVTEYLGSSNYELMMFRPFRKMDNELRG